MMTSPRSSLLPLVWIIIAWSWDFNPCKAATTEERGKVDFVTGLSSGTSTAAPGPAEPVSARPGAGQDLGLLRKLHSGLHLVDNYLAQVENETGLVPLVCLYLEHGLTFPALLQDPTRSKVAVKEQGSVQPPAWPSLYSSLHTALHPAGDSGPRLEQETLGSQEYSPAPAHTTVYPANASGFTVSTKAPGSPTEAPGSPTNAPGLPTKAPGSPTIEPDSPEKETCSTEQETYSPEQGLNSLEQAPYSSEQAPDSLKWEEWGMGSSVMTSLEAVLAHIKDTQHSNTATEIAEILKAFPISNRPAPDKVYTDLTRIQQVMSLWHQAQLNPEVICKDDQKAKFFTDKAFLLNMGKVIGCVICGVFTPGICNIACNL